MAKQSHQIRVKRAAKELRAKKLGPNRWAYCVAARWYVVTEAALARMCDCLDSYDFMVRIDPYTAWCAETAAEEMPQGWVPMAGVATR